MRRSRLLLTLAVLLPLTGCAMTFDGSKLGVPITMGSKAGSPAVGQHFKVSSGSIWVLWGSVPVKKPSLREPLGTQLVGGQSIEDVRITVHSKWYDVLFSVITLGIVTPRTVTLEGTIVGDASANLKGPPPSANPAPAGVAAAPIPVTKPLGPNDPTSQPAGLYTNYGNSSFEVTPFAAYVFGGGFPTTGSSTLPNGKLTLAAGIGFGVELGYTPNNRVWFEATYLRQTTDITFTPVDLSVPLKASGFATNYIHGGARYEFGQQNAHPFLGLGAGITIFDPEQAGIGTATEFSLSAEAGVRMMLGKGNRQRFGLRGTLRGWFSFVPNGTYQAWCDYYYGCYATQGTSTVTQGEGSLGIVILF